jgi:glycosyltransferase involved in cell wall biosynthesis
VTKDASLETSNVIPRVSVVICTLNRHDYLRKAIQSLLDQTVPQEQYEIVVVDNGSTDRTRDVVHDEFCWAENLRYIHEARPGLCWARNTGWMSAKGQYVAYLDDDAIACPEWLERILRIFETTKPTPGCVGGKVELIWEAPRPGWLSEDMVGYLSLVDWSSTPMVLSETEYLAGVNFAFPKTILQEVGGFDARLDRRGTNLLSHGDILIVRQLQKKGYACFYDPQISVQHAVSRERVHKRWFVRRSHWQGVSEVVFDQLLSPRSRVSLLKDAVAEIRLLAKALSGGYLLPRKLYWHMRGIPFSHWLWFGYLVGKIRQQLLLAFCLKNQS